MFTDREGLTPSDPLCAALIAAADALGADDPSLLCRHHHRAKRRDGWWPTLHPDGTVTWTHVDGRTRTDPAPAVIDDHVRTLLHATEPAEADRAPPHQHAAPGPGPPAAAA